MVHRLAAAVALLVLSTGPAAAAPVTGMLGTFAAHDFSVAMDLQTDAGRLVASINASGGPIVYLNPAILLGGFFVTGEVVDVSGSLYHSGFPPLFFGLEPDGELFGIPKYPLDFTVQPFVVGDLSDQLPIHFDRVTMPFTLSGAFRGSGIAKVVIDRIGFDLWGFASGSSISFLFVPEPSLWWLAGAGIGAALGVAAANKRRS